MTHWVILVPACALQLVLKKKGRVVINLSEMNTHKLCLTSDVHTKILKTDGHVLFNNVLNTFYLRLHGVKNMLKDHSDSERGNLLPPLHGLRFLISSKGSFICTIPKIRCLYHSLYYTSRGKLAGTRNSSIGPPWMIDPRNHHGSSITELHLVPINNIKFHIM